MAAFQRAKGGVGGVDTLSPAERSEIMARVRSKNSRPELFVRKLIFALGYRYRLHAKDLPGHPDIVFRKLRRVIFVHGCFWHRHAGCALARLPCRMQAFTTPQVFGGPLALLAEGYVGEGYLRQTGSY
jgi:DNA mismatch endonuclease (patch repair protein)